MAIEISNDLMDQVFKIYNEGKSLKNTGNEFGLSAATVKDIIEVKGGVVRNKGRQPGYKPQLKVVLPDFSTTEEMVEYDSEFDHSESSSGFKDTW